jgi:MFS family permease
MLIIYAYSQLHQTTSGYTALLISEYAGLSIAGLIFSLVIKRYSKGKWLALGNILMGIAVIVFALLHSVVIACIVAFFIGVLNLITNTISRTMLMESAGSGMRGVVMNLRFALGRPVNTLGAIFAGLLTEYSGAVSQSIILAGVVILFSGIIASFVSSIINYDEVSKKETELNLG